MKAFLFICLFYVSAVGCNDDSESLEFGNQRDSAGNLAIDLHISFIPGRKLKVETPRPTHDNIQAPQKLLLEDNDLKEEPAEIPVPVQSSQPSTNNSSQSESRNTERPSDGINVIIIYADEQFGGNSERLLLEQDQCMNLPHEWNNRVSSVETMGLCILIWDLADCNGKHVRIRPENPLSSRQLNRVRMNDETTSLELC